VLLHLKEDLELEMDSNESSSTCACLMKDDRSKLLAKMQFEFTTPRERKKLADLWWIAPDIVIDNYDSHEHYLTTFRGLIIDRLRSHLSQIFPRVLLFCSPQWSDPT
jgi:hypothetical protein